MVTHIVFQQTSFLLEGFWRNGVGWRNLIIYSNFALYRKWDNLASIMPFRKATNYKRFNVWEYMLNKRLAREGDMSKQKKAKCVSKKLKRLDDKLFSVREHLCNGLDECEKVNGFYRDIEDILVKLAEFYLNIGKYKLFNFNQPNSFHVAIGGDEAPFGRDDSACSWLVSFLYIGHGVSSRNENFLLSTENCLPVIAYSNHSTKKQLFNNCFLIWHLLFFVICYKAK
ncbi:uncharacterized protein LOC124435823 isoform X3 [Xenia sp. Carnegie-2017]|uniref:uncharacterized protein LOC124435823 isoform X3 n=1 Tax=Xenia sp. Carnegie-2017 TaxID=2897299 RepID=UPI001F04C541|nr:uncharacterized protein LOC124435823 isoform X3 [Xenia sp. Carnegie-2017]